MAIHLWMILFLALLHNPVSSRPTLKKCGERLFGTHGNVKSPNYPHRYDYNIQCEWIIEAPENQVIQLTFKDFDVESFAGECDTDKVHIRDGQDDSSASLGKVLCGQTIPEMLTSTGRYMKITFTTDYFSFSGRGFDADYVTVPAEKGQSCVTNACGGTIESTSCQIQSPGYPSSFQSALNCSWLIKAPHESHVISFHFLDLDLNAPNSLCKYNNVTIYDGENIHAPIIHESLCDIMHNRLEDNALISTGPIVFMRFRTSTSLTRHGLVNGFNAKFQVLNSDGKNVDANYSTSSTSTSTTTSSLPIATTTSTSAPTTIIATTTAIPASTTTKTTTQKKITPTTTMNSTTSKEENEKQSNNEEKATTSNEETTVAVKANLISNPATLSGLVIGIIVGGAVLVFGVLLMVAFSHWKKRNATLGRNLRDEDSRSDVNTLLSSTDSREFTENKKNASIVRKTETELL